MNNQSPADFKKEMATLLTEYYNWLLPQKAKRKIATIRKRIQEKTNESDN